MNDLKDGDIVEIHWENGDITRDVIKSIDIVARLTFDNWVYPELIKEVVMHHPVIPLVVGLPITDELENEYKRYALLSKPFMQSSTTNKQ